MAKKNPVDIANGKVRSVRYPSNTKCSPIKSEPATERLSPTKTSPRTSPGLGHYAGCKWTEPPSPSSLPPPPQHWMQGARAKSSEPRWLQNLRSPRPSDQQQPNWSAPARAFAKTSDRGTDIARQLKVLLKVHAWRKTCYLLFWWNENDIIWGLCRGINVRFLVASEHDNVLSCEEFSIPVCPVQPRCDLG